MKKRNLNKVWAYLSLITICTNSMSILATEDLSASINPVNQLITKNVVRNLLPAKDDVVIESSYHTLNNPGAATDGEKTDRAGTMTELSSDFDTQYNKGKSRYIQYDFGKPYDIKQINLYKNLYGNGVTTRHKDVKIEISNDPEFRTSTIVYEVNEYNEPANGLTITLDEVVNAQYIRLHSKGNYWVNPNGATGWSANNRYAEIEVLAVVDDTESMTSTFKNVAFENATVHEVLTDGTSMTDGKYNGKVAKHKEVGAQAIQLDLAKVYNVEKLALMLERGESYTDLKVYASQTPEYTEADLVINQDVYSQGEDKVDLTFTPKEARYITLYVNPGEENYLGIEEFAVYAEQSFIKEYERKNIAVGKVPGNKGKGILNPENFSDGDKTTYATLESHGNQYIQYGFKNRYPITQISMVLEDGVTYNNLQVSLSNSSTSGFSSVYNVGSYTQVGDTPLVIELERPQTASQVRIGMSSNTGEGGYAKFGEVEIWANLDKELEYDETPDPYIPPADTRYNNLVWGDEFNGEAVDETKWEIINGDPSLSAIYGREAVSISRDEKDSENGYLTIQSKYVGPELFENYRETIMNDYWVGKHLPGNEHLLQPETYPWLSGRVESKNKFSFLNGRVAVRAKVNDSQGIWPAIWMLAQDEKGSDEIDILEYLGQEKYRHYATNHYGSYEAPRSYSHGGSYDHYEELSQDFHVYEVEWRPDVIIFYFDGKEIFRTNRDAGTALDAMHDRPMHIIMETQVGGAWVGPTDPTGNNTRQDSNYLVDWVRVYQADDAPNVKFDDVATFKGAESQSEGLRIDTENAHLYFYGGQPIIERSRAVVTEEGQNEKQHIIYKAPELEQFHATAYYATLNERATPADAARGDYRYKSIYNEDLRLKFYVSADGETNWQEVTTKRNDNVNECYPAYSRKIFDGRDIPEGMNYLKVEFPVTGEFYDQIHLAKVTMVHKGEDVANETMITTVVGEDTVTVGDEFSVVVGVDEVKQPIYAADMILNYNENLFELVGTELLAPNALPLTEEEVALRILFGLSEGVADRTELLRLNFVASEVGTGTVAVNGAYGTVVEGNSQVVETDTVTKQIKVEEKAVDPGEVEDVNKDEVIDVADLAMIAYYYRAKVGDTNWEEAKKADVNNDGVVDTVDLGLVANKILNK